MLHVNSFIFFFLYFIYQLYLVSKKISSSYKKLDVRVIFIRMNMTQSYKYPQGYKYFMRYNSKSCLRTSIFLLRCRSMPFSCLQVMWQTRLVRSIYTNYKIDFTKKIFLKGKIKFKGWFRLNY